MRIRRIHIYVTIVFLVFIFCLSCASKYSSQKQEDQRWNLSAIYNPLSTKLHPVFRLYHQTDANSILYVKLFTSELQFQPLGKEGTDISKIKIEATLFEENEDGVIFADSVNQEFIIREDEATHVYYTQLAINAKKGKKYQLRVLTRDLIRKSFNLQFIDIDKSSRYSSQSFLLTDKNGIPHFSNIIGNEQLFKIQHASPGSDKIFINYYKNDVPLPKPDFPRLSDETVYHDPDSLWIITYSPNLIMQFTYPGMYFFRFDTTKNEGYAAINPGGGFPKVKETYELIESLFYITTDAEYKKLLSDENQKLAIDNFWLEAGNSTSRGRELIRIYYNRVYFANYYFTNARQGWKTDRGMIYVVYGPPENLRKNATSETWYYFKKGYSDPITFTFKHSPSNYSLNRYILDRSESHEWYWTDAVNSWKSGKIFLLD